MTEPIDFFFSSYVTGQTRRWRAALEHGLAHASRIEPLDPLPGQPVTLFFASRADIGIDQVTVYYTVDGSMPQGTRGHAEHGTVVWAEPVFGVYRDEDTGYMLRDWRADLPGQPEETLVRYRVEGWCQEDPAVRYLADAVDPVGIVPRDGRCFAYHVDTWEVPDWWRDAIVYQIFVDRFSAGRQEAPMRAYGECAITDFFGGTLQGVLERLDYIQDLGANCLWLSPICVSPSHHGYDPADYFTIDPRFGGNDALRRLVDEVHRRGMRIILDYVANHTSDQHPAFIAARRDPTGPTGEWYDLGDQHAYGYHCYANVPSMPDLNTDHPAVRRYLFDAALYWLDSFGADGLRLDCVPGPSHAFWAAFQREIKTRFPQALTLGEIVAPAGAPGAETERYAGRMDTCMNFPLAHMLRATFALRKTTMNDLLRFLDTPRGAWPEPMTAATLLDNHDMHRFLWLAQGDVARLKLAAACHLTLEGTPIIYYGTEVGLSQYDDAHRENAHCRAPMLWDERQDHDLLTLYRRLLALRHAHPALRRGTRANLPVTLLGAQSEAAQAQVGSYRRRLDDDDVLVVLNNNEHAATVHVGLEHPASEYALVYGEAELQEWSTAENLRLPALGAAILARRLL